MSYRVTSQTRKRVFTPPVPASSALSVQEKQGLSAIFNKLSDNDLWLLLVELRGPTWSQRASSLSASTKTRSQASISSFGTASSLYASSTSSKRASMMSIDVESPASALVKGQYTPSSQACDTPIEVHNGTHEIIPGTKSYSELTTSSSGMQYATMETANDDHVAIVDVKYQCTYPTGCDRPTFKNSSDWKDHETNFHQPVRKYLCAHSTDPMMPCRADFLSLLGAQKHHEAHRSSGCTKTCQPLRNIRPMVYACGVKPCTRLFTENLDQGEDAWSDRCRHFIQHFKDGLSISDWTHSHMLLNLLRQPNLLGMWDVLVMDKAFEQGLDKPAVCLWDSKNIEKIRQFLEIKLHRRPVTELDFSQINISLEEIYKSAILHFPGQRAMRNVGLGHMIATNEQLKVATEAGSTKLSLPIMGDAEQHAAASSGATISSAAEAVTDVLGNHYDSPSDDFATNEGTLRPHGRSQAPSGAYTYSTSARGHTRSIKKPVSKDHLALAGHQLASNQDLPPVPSLPVSFTQPMLPTHDVFQPQITQCEHVGAGSYGKEVWAPRQATLQPSQYEQFVDFDAANDNAFGYSQ